MRGLAWGGSGLVSPHLHIPRDHPANTLASPDQIALPDFNAGAMENWGLVTYRENALLFDPQSSSISNKERVVTVIAHELAHQVAPIAGRADREGRGALGGDGTGPGSVLGSQGGRRGPPGRWQGGVTIRSVKPHTQAWHAKNTWSRVALGT